jgi:hypothetical protein
MSTSHALLPWAALVALGLGGCNTLPAYDYTAFREHPPRSILILPPINESTAIEGTYGYLSTVTRPLGERGYYVFPVAVVDQMLKENGMPSAGEMHDVPLDKVREITGADAVFYPVLHEYGTKYHIISSDTMVSVSGRLVDTRTGTLLWEGKGVVNQGSGDSGGGLMGALVTALVSQAITSKMDQAHGVSRMANQQMFFTPKREIPAGRVLRTLVERPSGFDRLDDAAQRCVEEQGEFEPQRLDRQPVGSWQRMKWTWRLDEPEPAPGEAPPDVPH